MKKFASRLYDITDYVTNGHIEFIERISRGDEELIKNAYIPSASEYSEEDDEKFALILHHPHVGTFKKFATFDKYLTKLNIGILQEIAEEIPDEISKTAAFHLKKAAKFFGVPFPETLRKYAEADVKTNYINLTNLNQKDWLEKQAKLAKMEKSAYALPSSKRYPLNNKENVCTAVSYFEKRASQFEPREACEFALNVVKKAGELGVDIRDTRIDKYAHLSIEDVNPDFADHIRSRKTYVEERESEKYEDLISKRETNGVVKTAALLHDLDIQTGLYRKWGRGIEDPVLSVLCMKKEASVLHEGKEVTLGKLRELRTDIVDSDTLRDLQSDIGLDVFESLPTPVKTELTSLL